MTELGCALYMRPQVANQNVSLWKSHHGSYVEPDVWHAVCAVQVGTKNEPVQTAERSFPLTPVQVAPGRALPFHIPYLLLL